MARYILCNRIPYDGVELKAGKEIDDSVYELTRVIASGAVLVLMPSPIVEARAREVRQQQGRGRREAELDLLTAAFAELASGGSGSVLVLDEGVELGGF